ncbi:conserved hypothetical protein [Cupriavidus necator]|uniref:Uncharacterized protein n=1 Tax=Cupriavidus necator TaxID=106590 RepID=A0A1K0IEH5_CUPNE|nr:conserved hypothetical protein [Cupriavidus necator]
MELNLEEIKAAALSPDAMRRLGNWILHGDTGVSSETMAAIALGADVMKGTGWGPDAPRDPSDFGRCYHLVQAVPEIRATFPRIACLVPAFAGILANWDELAGIYEHALRRSGPERHLYERIKQLRGD